MTKTKIGAGALLALLLTLLAGMAPASAGGDKIAFCHATGSETNPYNLIETSTASFFNAGHVGHEGDVYPAGSHKDESWEAQGDQSLIANGCETPRPEQPGPEPSIKNTLVCKDGVWVTDHYLATYVWQDGQWVLGKPEWVSKETRPATAIECGYQPTTRTKDTLRCKDDALIRDYYVTTYAYDKGSKSWVATEEWSHKEVIDLTEDQRLDCAGERHEDDVVYSEWVDGAWECGDTTVQQTRTVTTTPYKPVYTNKVGWSWVLDAENAVVTTETQERTLSEEESTRDCPYVCEANYFEGFEGRGGLWEITYGTQHTDTNGVAVFTNDSYGGLVSFNEGDIPAYMVGPEYRWLYVYGDTPGKVYTWDFADGTRVTATVAYAEHGCPQVAWMYGTTPPEVIDLPAVPTVEDPCGPGNAEYVLPGDTEFITWQRHEDGSATATAAEGYTFGEGPTAHFPAPTEINTAECITDPEPEPTEEPTVNPTPKPEPTPEPTQEPVARPVAQQAPVATPDVPVQQGLAETGASDTTATLIVVAALLLLGGVVLMVVRRIKR